MGRRLYINVSGYRAIWYGSFEVESVTKSHTVSLDWDLAWRGTKGCLGITSTLFTSIVFTPTGFTYTGNTSTGNTPTYLVGVLPVFIN